MTRWRFRVGGPDIGIVIGRFEASITSHAISRRVPNARSGHDRVVWDGREPEGAEAVWVEREAVVDVTTASIQARLEELGELLVEPD